jgi:hypothetical protein
MGNIRRSLARPAVAGAEELDHLTLDVEAGGGLNKKVCELSVVRRQQS